MNWTDEQQQAYFNEQEQLHDGRPTLEEQMSNKIDTVMDLADEPDLVEFYGLQK